MPGLYGGRLGGASPQASPAREEGLELRDPSLGGLGADALVACGPLLGFGAGSLLDGAGSLLVGACALLVGACALLVGGSPRARA